MKFYRDFQSIFKNNIYLVVGCGIVIPLFILYLIRPYFEITDGSGASIVIILFFCMMWISAAYGIFKISLSLRDRNKITLEFNDTGVRYPYLLDDSIEIVWGAIVNIEYVVDRTNDTTEYYILIELNENVDVGKFKKVPNTMYMNIVQKRYDSKILLVYEEILKGYKLPNVAEIMNAYRKRQTCQQIEVAEDYPVRYKGAEGTWGEYLLKIFFGLGAVSYAIYGILSSIADDIMSDSPSFMAYVGVGVSGFLGLFVLYCLITGVISRIKQNRGTKNAIACSYKGIHLVNDVSYVPCIVWSHVQEIRVNEDDEPKLIIELKDSAAQSQKRFEIKNDLANTSIYEVCNVLNDFHQFNGY